MLRRYKKLLLIAISSITIAILTYMSISAQVTVKIPKPRNIEGTVALQRPIVWKQGKYGGKFIDTTFTDPKTFNPTQAEETSSTDLINRFLDYTFNFNYDTNVWYVEYGDPTKGKTGKGYTVEGKSDGSVELTVYMRNDLVWSDGKPFTAEDVVFYHNDVCLNEEVGDPCYFGQFLEMPNGEEKPITAELIDKYTFKKIFPRAIADLELYANQQIVPKHIFEPALEESVEAVRSLWALDTKPSELIGNGPFLLSEYVSGQRAVFKKNPNYYLKDDWGQKLPYIDEYVLLIVADQDVEFLKFQNKESSAYSLRGEDFQTLVPQAKEKNFTVWNGGAVSSNFFISLNQNPNSPNLKAKPYLLEAFSNKKFRQAISHLINREQLIVNVYNNLGEPSIGYFSYANPFFDPKIVANVKYDPDKSLELLRQMGIRNRGGECLEDRKGNDIGFEIVTNAGNTEREQIVNILSSDFSSYGVCAKPNAINFNVLVNQLMDSFDWEAVVISITGGAFMSGTNVWPSSGSLHLWNPLQEKPATPWEARIDAMWDAGRFSIDFKERKKWYDQMQKLLYDELPMIPLVRQYNFISIYNEWDNVNWDTYSAVGDDNQRKLFVK